MDQNIESESIEDEIIDNNNQAEIEKSSKEHQLWLERERLAQIEWRAKKALEVAKQVEFIYLVIIYNFIEIIFVYLS